MIVAISVGACYDLRLSYSEAIKFIQHYSVDGIELLFAAPKDLMDFEFEEENLDYVKSLKFKSIHMPVRDAIYEDSLITKKVIDKATVIANQINADYLVFHPNTITDYSILDWTLKNCVENLNSKECNKGFQTVHEMKKVLEKHDGLGLVLDTCHMLEAGVDPKEFLELKEYVKGIHLAVQWRQGERIRTHGFLQENPEQLEQIKPLLKLDVPKIIESDFYPEKVPLIEKEIELIKSLEY